MYRRRSNSKLILLAGAGVAAWFFRDKIKAFWDSHFAKKTTT